jgi:signal peptidase I
MAQFEAPWHDGAASAEEAVAKRQHRALLAFLVILLAITIFTYLNFRTVVVRGHSMEGSFHDGQRVLMTRAYWLFGQPEVGDVVVLRDSDSRDARLIVKRVAGVAGDVIPPDLTPDHTPLVVPARGIFVMGDNMAVSEDSRRFGPVPDRRVVGKVVTQ